MIYEACEFGFGHTIRATKLMIKTAFFRNTRIWKILYSVLTYLRSKSPEKLMICIIRWSYSFTCKRIADECVEVGDQNTPHTIHSIWLNKRITAFVNIPVRYVSILKI